MLFPLRLAILFLIVCALAIPQQGRRFSDAEVRAVHESALLIDTHNDLPIQLVRGLDIGKPAPKAHTDIPRLREGGVGAVFFAAWVSPNAVRTNETARRALEAIDAIRYDIVEKHPGHFALALSADDIEAARRQGKMAALIGVEGGHAIDNSLRLLRAYYDLGARYMTLTHSNTNAWADSSGDIDKPAVKRHSGLTDFGRQVVREMNRLGMIVDVSHVSDETFWDVLETSSAPVFASHSSCRALCDHPRNLTDDMIRALAKNGGLIQINFYPEYLTTRKQPPASIDDVVAHIHHAVQVAGVDAVGIGTDYDGIDKVPVGLEDVSRFPALTRALLEKGYSPADIRKIYGANMLRLMRVVARARKAGR